MQDSGQRKAFIIHRLFVPQNTHLNIPVPFYRSYNFLPRLLGPGPEDIGSECLRDSIKLYVNIVGRLH